MSLKKEFFNYLDHFGCTVPVRDMAAMEPGGDAIALRHDIDHDLDLALEAAHHEHARGLRASYFLLPTHPYWNDPQLIAKCRQLEAYGHEVGVHVNVITEWVQGAIDDPAARLREQIEKLRAGGIGVVGVSAHGDKACYRHQFINYWLFRDFRSDDPAKNEAGRSAEGIVVEDARWQVRYPESHALARCDGATLLLWQTSLAELGLSYDAVHVACDRYWTDTGGSWKRSGDPLDADLSKGRHQVLMHPFWWRGARKHVFVLSAARSGSNWLANFVDRATSARGLHEWTLNHRREEEAFVPDKRTNDDYASLMEDVRTASGLLRAARAFFSLSRGDVVEANVYLEPFLEQMQAVMPEAVLVHLHRDGRDVVRSTLNRGWYDTPLDRRHRTVPVDGWENLTQFERACWYWRYTNERIERFTDRRLAFEQMVRDLGMLTAFLGELGIVVHPLLAAEEFPKRLNAGSADVIPAWAEWPEKFQAAFASICGEMQRTLGYDIQETGDQRDFTKRGLTAKRRELLDIEFLVADPGGFSFRQLSAAPAEAGMMLIHGADHGTSSHVVLTRGRWDQVPIAHGLCVSRSARVILVGSVEAEVPAGPLVRLFVLFFDAAGKQIAKRQATTLRPEERTTPFACRWVEGASHAALAVHMTNAHPGDAVTLVRLRVDQQALDPDYLAASAFQPVRR